MKITQIAKLTKITYKHLWSIINSKSRPSPELARKLEKVTGVSRLAWLYPDEFPNPYIKDSKLRKGKRGQNGKG